MYSNAKAFVVMVRTVEVKFNTKFIGVLCNLMNRIADSILLNYNQKINSRLYVCVKFFTTKLF